MAYKYVTGSVYRGDIYDEDDAERNTYIDWTPSGDALGIVAGGTTVFVVSGSTAKVGVGTAAPTTTLHAYADVSDAYVALIDNDAGSNSHGLKVTSDGTGTGTTLLDIEAGSTTVFKVRGDGRVGIGVATPGSTLSVDDEIAVGEKVIHRGDSDTYLQFPGQNQMNLVANGYSFLKYDGDILINNANRDRDTKIMADDGNVVLHVDAGDNRVGIGTTSPEAYLDIKNTTDDGATNRTMVQLYNYRADDADTNDWASTSIDFKIENVAGGVKGATARIATVIAPSGTTHTSTEGEKSSALIFSTMDDNTLSEAARINNLGYVGIGTTNPGSTLEVSGSQAVNYAQTAASITFTETHFIVDYTGNGDATFTLPAPSGVTGRMYYVVSHAQGALDALTVTSSGDATTFQGPNVEGGSQANVAIDGNTPQSLHLISTGADWFILHDGRAEGH